MEEDMEEVSTDEEWEDEEEAISITCCMFCKHECKDMGGNIQHMSDKHSFFIPDLEFVTDLEGLLLYIGQRIGKDLTCPPL